MFGCNPARSGVCATTGLRAALLDASQPGEIPVAWTFRTGRLSRSSPTVAHGRVYVGSHDGNPVRA